MADGPWAVNSIVLASMSRQDQPMKANPMVPIFAILLLASCSPLTIYYKEGAGVSRMQSDLLRCEVSAAQEVPVATEFRSEPPYYVPGRRVCYRNGKCYLQGGFFLPGQVYTVDANRGLRGRVEAQCMADKGYSPVSLPRCSSDVARRVPPGATRTLPALAEKNCVIRNDDGSWQIVNLR
jgi:hypothetical protein